MELSTAIHLIRGGVHKSDSPQRWADLGAGEGLFTKALATLLPDRSSILAVDQNEKALESIEWNFESVSLEIRVGNFATMNWGGDFDGVLMANTLHYVIDQPDFLRALKSTLSPEGLLIVVEYERSRPNAWVPYPLKHKELERIGLQAGFSAITKLAEVPSVYDNSSIYSAVLSW